MSSNQDFVDPLGANAPGFENQPEYNPLSSRSRTQSSGGRDVRTDANNNRNGGQQSGIRFRSHSQGTYAPATTPSESSRTPPGTNRRSSNPGSPSIYHRSSEDLDNSQRLYSQMAQQTTQQSPSTRANIYNPEEPSDVEEERRTSIGQNPGPAQGQMVGVNQTGSRPTYRPLTFGPQEREMRKTVNTEVSEKHVLYLDIVNFCREVEVDRLNQQSFLKPLRMKVNRLKMWRDKPLDQRYIARLDEQNNVYIRTQKFTSMHDQQEKRLLQFHLEPAELGTFPTFRRDGGFPEEGVKFNPIVTSYCDILGEYTVGVDIEIPLPQLKKSFLTTLYPPMHQFKYHCCYLMDSILGDGSQHLYVLPAGHYRDFMTEPRKAKNLYRIPDSTLTVPGTNEVWQMYRLEVGLYYHSGKVFYLPKGTLLTMQNPHIVKPLALLAESIHLDMVEKFFQVRKQLPRRQASHYRELWRFFHKDNRLMAAAKFHSARLPQSVKTFLEFFIFKVKPGLDCRDPTNFVTGDLAAIGEQMEIAAFVLQVRSWNGYYGPAPPHHVLKEEPVHTGTYARWLLRSKDTRRLPRDRAIGPDGFPEARPEFGHGPSPLLSEEGDEADIVIPSFQ